MSGDKWRVYEHFLAWGLVALFVGGLAGDPKTAFIGLVFSGIGFLTAIIKGDVWDD